MLKRMTSLFTATILLGATLTVAPIAAPLANAAGTPDIEVSKAMPAEVLFGEPIPVTVSIANNSGSDGYNMMVRDVLPAGVSYVPGSASPDPTELAQVDGSTVLVWSNISDSLNNTVVALGYSVETGVGYSIGSIVTNEASAYVNSDPRTLPKVAGAAGTPVASSYTGNDDASASTLLIPFELTKTEPNTEAELLRGVHDHKTTYTLTVDNNLLVASNNFTLVDYLPAGLEFLGCSAVDNSAAATFEYTGASTGANRRIDDTGHPPFANACANPISVTTVTDPGTVNGVVLPAGVYTRVEWDAASLIAADAADDLTAAGLAPATSFSIDYAAAIPLRENVQASLANTTANLDNNTGALTTDEQALENFAFVGGDTDAISYTDDDTFVVSAEDLSIHKSVDSDNFVHGAPAVWTFEVESSEYALSTDTVITVTDTIPNGLEYVSSTLPLSSGPTVDAIGAQIVEWEIPAYPAASSSTTFTMTTAALTDYRAPLTGPVAANDSWTNSVVLVADATIITDNDGSTTSGIVLPDDSSAGQAAGPVTILKEVATPIVGTVTCGDGSSSGWDEIIERDYRAGDRVCWRLTVKFPGQLDTLSPFIKDFLPAGYEYESWAFGAGNNFASGVNFASTTDDLAAGVLIWDLDDADPDGTTVELIVSSILADTSAVSNADITANLMKFSFINTDGSLFQLRDQADARYIEPILTAQKNSDATGPVAGGDNVGYTVTFENAGFLEALNATVVDTLPTGITCNDVTLGPVPAPGAVSCPLLGTSITWTGITVPAGTEVFDLGEPTGTLDTAGTVDLTYSVSIPAIFSPGSSFMNSVEMTDWETTTNSGDGPKAFVDGPTADETVTIEDATIAKTRGTQIDVAGNGDAAATIGETVTYVVTAVIPEGTLSGSPEITDSMPTGIRLDTATLVTSGGATGTLTSNAAGFTVTLADPYLNPIGSGADTFQITVAATVLEIASNLHNIPRTNGASLSWGGGSASANVDVTVVEPSLVPTKNNDSVDDEVVPGQEVEYTITLTDAQAPANDVTVVDTLPLDLIPLDGPGGTQLTTTGQTVASGGIWHQDDRTITWTSTEVAGLATVLNTTPLDLVYQVQVRNPLGGGLMLTNTVDVAYDSMPGDDPDERDYTAAASDSVTAPVLSVPSKTASVSDATVGDTVDYTIGIRVPAGVIGYDLTVLDQLPAGMAFESLLSVNCEEPGSLPCIPARTAIALNSAGDTGTIGFYIGDLVPGSVEEQELTFVYRARVLDDDVNVVAPADLDNSARSYSNFTDKIDDATITAPPAAGSFDSESDEQIAEVDVIEPTLTIDKDVAGQTGDTDTRRHKPGDVVTYTVRVENTGTSPAYDVSVTDTPDARLTTFVPLAGISTTANTDATPADGTLAWFLDGPILPGAANAVTIEYTLTIPNTLDESDEVAGFEVVNTADISSYFGQSNAVRTNPANAAVAYRTYGVGDYEVIADTVNIELDLASIGNRVWYDINGDGVQDSGEPGLNGVDVTVTFLNGPGSTDDEVVTVTTAGNGEWIVDELPGGSYTVDVNVADVPAGLSPSWDLDDLLVSPDGDWAGMLGEDEAKRDVDAGFTGAGSIGNLVWFDQDLSGTQNGNEPGLGGIEVTLEWGGPDENLASPGDNVTTTTTTAADGSYLFDMLPAGPYRVTVAGGDLPTGMSFVSDPDAGTADGISLSLLSATGAGMDDLTRDFGAAGALSIGDTVYLDRDANGSQAVLGEPGLEGVLVTLTYAGADGILGGAGAADDITFTDTTDGSGNYLFENLPPEDYSITIGGPLPTGAVNTDDPDTVGVGDSTSTIALIADNLDQDFGYDVNSAIGDRVWWDLDRDGVQDAGEPGINGVAISVTYLGPDGVDGGGDDLVFTTTTSVDGDWSITDIPNGNYVVAVGSGIPAGFTATYDDDSGIVSPDSTSDVTLTTLDEDQDFGYAGNSSIGDTVWLDLDGNGMINGDEVGIADVTVNVTWGGPDGIVGGANAADDVTFTRTTDADGEYLVEGLPAGAYAVTVDDTSLPNAGSGMSITYDQVGGTAAPSNTTTVALAANTDLDTIDFGYRGDSSIGDTVYWDRNGDGDQDTPGNASDEPGLSGVTVNVTWAGPDGNLATTDDNGVFTATTDANGAYLVDNLPAGTYAVDVVTSTVPNAMTNTDDEDGDNDSNTPVTLGANDDHLTADFGYNGSASIGDTIYLDLDGSGDQAATGEPGVPGQTVTLNFEGADGILGNADDIVLTTVTDANGQYSFDNLPDGDYRVTVVGGITDDATNTDDPNGGTANQADVTIAASASNDAQDFGYQGDNSLGDTIWWDVNRDGVVDATSVEPRLAGIDVLVTYAGADGVLGGAGAADDIVITTVATDTNGEYVVTGLPDGDYSVAIVTATLPAGMDNTYDSSDGVIGDGGTDPDSVSTVNLPGATNDRAQDFGYAGTGSIGDLVYFDRNGDGIQDAIVDEPGISGAEVTLTFAGPDGVLGGAGAADDIVIVQIADADGGYDFGGLPAGEYTVAVTDGLPPGAINSDDPDLTGAAPDAGDSTSSVSLTAGADNNDQDFGFDVDAGLGDRVWWDFNRDGVQDADEPGVNGVEITVTFLGDDGVLDAGPGGDDELFVTTTATVGGVDGTWAVNDIPEGNYQIAVTNGIDAGFTPTFDPDSGIVAPDLTTQLLAHSGLNVAQDFGIAGNSSIGDTVWLDLDGDGTVNGQEIGLEGVEVALTWFGPDGVAGGTDDQTFITTTDANGGYLFEGLPAGEFSVTVDPAGDTLPDGLTPSYDLDGTTAAPDGTTAVTLAANTAIDDVDFGYQGISSIGDTVFFDRDNDGVFDPAPGTDTDEPGLPGVVIELTWAGEDGILGNVDDHVFTTMTDLSGNYSFDGLPAGEYIVDVVGATLPIAVTNTVDEDGDNNGSTPVTLGVDDDHDTADFGYAGVASIGDTIYLDLDGDGLQGLNEPGVAGQTVTLVGPAGTLTTTTGPDGAYSFDNLPDGDYTVTVTGGVVGTAANTDDPDSLPGAGDSTAAVTITGGISNDAQDFGYQGSAALGDTIFFDTANNGIDDGAATDPRLGGVDVVVVWHGPDGVLGTDDDVTIPVDPTDVNGVYAVTGLPTGSYTVTPDVTDLPAGLTPTVDDDGGADGTSTVTLADGETNNDQDFAFTGTGSIGDTVWLDIDADGVFDANEAGIEGATVTITWLGPDGVAGGSDDVIYITTVADDGTYLVENLPAGDFTVEVSGLPAGLSGDTTSSVNLDPGENDVDQDFPFVGSASVGDTVFLDIDDDGVQSSNEPGIEGVTVTVTSAGVDGVLGTDDDLVVTTTTGPGGTYTVPGVPPGPTQVSIDPATLLPGTNPSADADGGDPAVSLIDLADGENNVDQDFGVAGPGGISGTITDEGESTGLGGIVITITYDGPNGPVVITTTTEPDGTYTAGGLPIGDYTVEVLPGDLPAGYLPLGPTSVDVTVTTGDPTHPGINFSFAEPGSIGRVVFIDLNNNGRQDPGEGGAAGVSVTLLDSDGNVVASVQTNGDGEFLFGDLPPGTYIVVLDPTTYPLGLVLTVDPDGNVDGRVTITLGPGEDNSDAVFGLIAPTLPRTGSELGRVLGLAALFLAAGVALLAIRRRRGVLAAG